MDDLKTIISDSLLSYKEDLKRFSGKKEYVQTVKCAQSSDDFRKNATELYLKKGHDNKMHRNIFDLYCKSITHAPKNSEQLASAFAKRSVFLKHIDKYEDCISDVDKALGIRRSDDLLKIQLLSLKIECLKRLGLPGHSDTLREAQGCVQNIVPACRDACEMLISKMEAMSIQDNNGASKKNNELHESEDFLNQVTISHDENFGRHLVAAQDYKPGDIIFVEKLYATDMNPEVSHIFCNYCLKLAWSGIPCENCNWAIFCSDLCKEKALKAHHDVECTLIPYLRSVKITSLETYYHVSLRLLILGLKETGGIAELKQELIAVEESSDSCFKGFSTNGKFENKTIRSVLSLTSVELDDFELETCALAVLFILVGIAKHTRLIENFEFTSIDDLMVNEDAVVLGSLLLKLTIVKMNNCLPFSHKVQVCEKSKNVNQCVMESCCARGQCLAPLASLLNHSCFPNASKFFTEDQKIVVFAQQHIKRNTQIFISYCFSFYHVPFLTRKEILKKYGFECGCEACNKQWIPLLSLTRKELEEQNYFLNNSFEKKLYDKCYNIFEALDKKSDHFNKGAIQTLTENLMGSLRFEQPSLITSLLIEALNTVYSCVYGLKAPFFGQCNV